MPASGADPLPCYPDCDIPLVGEVANPTLDSHLGGRPGKRTLQRWEVGCHFVELGCPTRLAGGDATEVFCDVRPAQTTWTIDGGKSAPTLPDTP